MNFDQAISAHVRWKGKLKEYLAKPNGSLSPAAVALDNKCDLGKWIAEEGAKHANLAEFQAVRSEHARFHKIAADIVHRADSGQKLTEEVVLGSKSEFAGASARVVNAIVALKGKVEEHDLVTK
jgi:hypothetical protein